MPASDPGLCRASVHSGATVVDVALPAAVPVAVLIPSIVDLLNVREPRSVVAATRYHLSRPGASALDPSLTLTQHGIDDGAILLLSQSAAPPPEPRYDDAAEAVSAALDAAARPGIRTARRQAARLVGAVAAVCMTGGGALALVRTAISAKASRDFGVTAGVAALAGIVAATGAVIACRTYRAPVAGLTLSVIATLFAAVAGFLVVPGAPGFPHVLLAATAAGVVSVSAARASGRGSCTLSAVASVAMFIAAAALVGVITAAPVCAVGAASALVFVGLLGVAPRIAIVLAGLSPQPDAEGVDPIPTYLAAKALQADTWLVTQVAAYSSSAAVGAFVTVLAGAHRLCCIVFGALTGGLLLLSSRCGDSRRMLVFVISGTAVVAATFAVSAWRLAQHGPGIAAATALLSAAAMYLGFATPTISVAPFVRRSIEVLEFLALAAMVPLTCGICGLYGAVRGLNLL